MLNLTQLYYFKIIAKHEHLTKASQELLMTQPALSRSLANLEEKLGLQLFEREGRTLKLNQYGKILLRYANTIFQELAEIPISLREKQQRIEEILEIGSINTALSTSWLIRFYKNYPSITLKHKTIDEANIFSELANNTINFAITTKPSKDDDFISLTLFRDAYLILVSKEHYLRKITSLYFKETKGLEFIALPQNYRHNRFIDYLDEQAGHQSNIVFEGESEFLMPYLLDTKTATIVLKSSYRSFNKFFPNQFHPIEIKDSFAHFEVFCSWKPSRTKEKAYQKFIAHLKTLQKD